MEMTRFAPWGVLLALAAGCGGSTAPEPEGVAAVEQAVSTCTGPSGAFCRMVTPAEAGTPGSGSYPDAHVVIRPVSPTKPELIVFLPGTGGRPENVLSTPYADADHSLYASATSKGYRIIGLSYQNEPSIGSLCGANDACYLPTRRTLITGDVQPGSAVTSIVKGDAILPRLTRLIRYLRDTVDSGYPGNWGSYFVNPWCTTDCTLNPSKLIFAGHSQGGGHAGVIGKDYPVRRVVTLASPCDDAAGVPANWTLPPLTTPPGSDSYRGLVARGRVGLTFIPDFCEDAAIAHWGADRLAASWTRVTSATGLCPTEPHACVVKDAQMFTYWQALWP